MSEGTRRVRTLPHTPVPVLQPKLVHPRGCSSQLATALPQKGMQRLATRVTAHENTCLQHTALHAQVQRALIPADSWPHQKGPISSPE